MNKKELQAALEAILFIVQKPIKASKLFSVLSQDGLSIDNILEALVKIKEEKSQESSGIYLASVAGGYQFRTKEQFSKHIKKLDGTRQVRLSNPALEVLSIIAYNQPVAKVFVQEIRSVDSSHIFKQLLDKGFIKIEGRSKKIPGSPLMYTTTKFFLEYFGINDLSELPSLKEATDMITTGTDTDIKIDFIKNLKEIKTIDFDNDEVLREHDKVIKNLTKLLKVHKNGQIN